MIAVSFFCRWLRAPAPWRQRVRPLVLLVAQVLTCWLGLAGAGFAQTSAATAPAAAPPAAPATTSTKARATLPANLPAGLPANAATDLQMGLATGSPTGLAKTAAETVPDTLAQRLMACTGCHGAQGRATPLGYFPRIAGKPADYLYRQLLHFRDGGRTHAIMATLLQPLSDDYLREIAGHFASLNLPYPPPPASSAEPAMLARGQQLALQGDAARQVPACVVCHGAALTGVAPAWPALLGLPRDYLTVQLGSWRSGQRRATAPDCMALIVSRLSGDDLSAVAAWLAAQPVPADSRPVARLPKPPPLPCGSAAPLPGVAAAAAASAPTRASGLGPAASAAVARGAYLALAGNCAGCHTSPGGPPYAGGRGIATPFGTVFAGNLTPDAKTGLGGWTGDDFWQALHHGRGPEGRRLVPVFPYTAYTLVTRADSDDLWAYLQSLAPVVQANQAHALRFPYDTQAALAVWQTLFFTPGKLAPEPGRSLAWNRGAYLVQGLGHCAACHGSRNLLGALDNATQPGGGPLAQQGWYAPSLLSPHEAGMADWTQAEVVQLLRTGRAPRGSAMGPMAEVVQRSTQHLSEPDLNAIAEYLRAMPGQPVAASAPARAASKPAPQPGSAPLLATAPAGTPAPAQAPRASSPPASAPATAPATAAAPARTPASVATERQLAQGAKLYSSHCAACHGDQGQGKAGAYPPLAGNRAVTMTSATNPVRVLLQGGFTPATTGNPRPHGMPPALLDDDDIAAVLSFARQSWGNRAGAVSGLMVRRLREDSE